MVTRLFSLPSMAVSGAFRLQVEHHNPSRQAPNWSLLQLSLVAAIASRMSLMRVLQTSGASILPTRFHRLRGRQPVSKTPHTRNGIRLTRLTAAGSLSVQDAQ